MKANDIKLANEACQNYEFAAHASPLSSLLTIINIAKMNPVSWIHNFKSPLTIEIIMIIFSI